VQANPLPIALTGIGLAWLMARANATPPASAGADRDWDRRLTDNGQSYDRGDHRGDAYPYARISGTSLRRVRHVTDEAGQRYAEFTDDAGAKFKALSDGVGNRTGHFADEAGSLYRGFTDEAGTRVSTFLDEAGNRLEDAQGWASDTWEDTEGRVDDLRHAVADRAADLQQRAASAGSQLQSSAGSMGKTVSDLLHDQPLIGGALAFAVGAAIASALPTTQQEDELLGESSDRLKSEGAKLAGNVYEQGKQQIGEAYEQTRQEAASTYEKVKSDLVEGATTNG